MFPTFAYDIFLILTHLFFKSFCKNDLCLHMWQNNTYTNFAEMCKPALSGNRNDDKSRTGSRHSNKKATTSLENL